MDEPTSVLTPQEVETLFVTLRRLAAEGCSILYISHKLEEIRALCDTATIMRLGRVVAHCSPREKSAKELAELMIAAELEPQARSRRVVDRARAAAPGRRPADDRLAQSVRRRSEGSELRRRAGRDPRHRRHRRQRPERADGRAVRRDPRRQAGDDPPRRRRGRPYGPARAARARRLLRPRGAQRPWRGQRDDAGRQRLPHRRSRAGRCRASASSGAARCTNSPARSSRASTCAPPAPRPRRGRCPAAICRSSWSAARSCRRPRR